MFLFGFLSTAYKERAFEWEPLNEYFRKSNIKYGFRYSDLLKDGFIFGKSVKVNDSLHFHQLLLIGGGSWLFLWFYWVLFVCPLGPGFYILCVPGCNANINMKNIKISFLDKLIWICANNYELEIFHPQFMGTSVRSMQQSLNHVSPTQPPRHEPCITASNSNKSYLLPCEATFSDIHLIQIHY